MRTLLLAVLLAAQQPTPEVTPEVMIVLTDHHFRLTARIDLGMVYHFTIE